MKLAKKIAAVFLASIALAGFASPAYAADTYVTGTQVSGLPSGKMDGINSLGSYDRSKCTFVTNAWIRYSDKSVWVRDDCSDGIFAAVRIGWRQGDTYKSYICVNRGGAGTMAKCNIDWPLGASAQKTWAAGLASPSPNPNQYQWGTYAAIYN